MLVARAKRKKFYLEIKSDELPRVPEKRRGICQAIVPLTDVQTQ